MRLLFSSIHCYLDPSSGRPCVRESLELLAGRWMDYRVLTTGFLKGDTTKLGMVFHVLNRGVGRRVLFTKDQDFLAFERVVEETLRTRRMQLCAYCLMPNHWHFVVWPERDGDL